MQRRKSLRLIAAGLLVSVLLAAASQAAERPGVAPGTAVATGPVWPMPPQPARVRFVQSVGGAADWGVARSVWGRIVDVVTGRHALQFVRPTGVAEQDGVLYIADAGAQSVIVFDAPRHKEIRVTRAGNDVLVSPVAVAPGPQQTVYVADSYLKKVLLLDRDGNLLRVVASAGLERPSSLAFDVRSGRLYVGDSKAHVVHVFDAHGTAVAVLGRLGAGPGEFNTPTHLAVAPNGDLAVTDALNYRVQVFSADGQFKYQIGEIGDGSGNFAAPKGVGIDQEGQVFVADAMFDAVQIFDPSGRLLLGFGGQGQQAGQFWMPNGLYIEGDRLFVADAYNRRIQVFLLEPRAAGQSALSQGAQP